VPGDRGMCSLRKRNDVLLCESSPIRLLRTMMAPSTRSHSAWPLNKKSPNDFVRCGDTGAGLKSGTCWSTTAGTDHSDGSLDFVIVGDVGHKSSPGCPTRQAAADPPGRATPPTGQPRYPGPLPLRAPGPRVPSAFGLRQREAFPARDRIGDRRKNPIIDMSGS
jgi:hypothetical protein